MRDQVVCRRGRASPNDKMYTCLSLYFWRMRQRSLNSSAPKEIRYRADIFRETGVKDLL